MRMRSPNNAGRAVQTDPTLLRCASEITEQKKCRGLAHTFDRFQTLGNNIQQGVGVHTDTVTSNNVWSCCPTLLRPFAGGFSAEDEYDHVRILKQAFTKHAQVLNAYM